MKPKPTQRQLDDAMELANETARARAADRDRTRRPVRFGRQLADLPTRQVVCRDCAEPVELSGFADMLAKAATPLLARMGEPPLEDGELTRCESCSESWRARRHLASLEVSERAKVLIRRRSATEFELDWLERHGFHDSAQVIRDAMSGKTKAGARTRRRGDDEP